MMGGAEEDHGQRAREAATTRAAIASRRRSSTKLVHAQPANEKARDLLADVWEQIGYQQESPSVRNSFLAAAYELRNGVPSGLAPSTVSADMVAAMTTDLLLDFMAIRLDHRKAGDDEFTINLVTPDTDERYVLELSNSVLTNVRGYTAGDAELTLIINRSDLDRIFLGQTKLAELVEGGIAGAKGDLAVIERLMSYQVEFDRTFQMVPGAGKPADAPARANVFEAASG